MLVFLVKTQDLQKHLASTTNKWATLIACAYIIADVQIGQHFGKKKKESLLRSYCVSLK